MSSPLDNFEKMQKSLEKTLRITETFNQQASVINNTLRSLSLSPISDYYSALSAAGSPSIINAAKDLSSSPLVSSIESLSLSGVSATANALTNSTTVRIAKYLSTPTLLSDALNSSASIPQTMLDSTALAQKLANQLTISPVYSVSPIAAEISSRIIDSVSGAFTSSFLDLAAEIREMPINSFEYSFDDAGNVNLSEQLGDKLSDIIDIEPTRPNSPRKIISKEFFYNVVMPIVLALMQLGYTVYSDAQLTELLERQHQEKMTIQRQILDEERQQTEYLRRISESSKESIPAKEDSPSS